MLDYNRSSSGIVSWRINQSRHKVVDMKWCRHYTASVGTTSSSSSSGEDVKEEKKFSLRNVRLTRSVSNTSLGVNPYLVSFCNRSWSFAFLRSACSLSLLWWLWWCGWRIRLFRNVPELVVVHLCPRPFLNFFSSSSFDFCLSGLICSSNCSFRSKCNDLEAYPHPMSKLA